MINTDHSLTGSNNKSGIILCRIIAVIIGIFLLFSALAKTQPISYFISTIYSHFALQYAYVTLLAQFIVALEASLGLMLIMGLLGNKRWVLWMTYATFIIFTAFVVYIWYKDGENADCGCLGDWVKLSPLSTLIKNIILIILTTFLLLKYKKTESKSRYVFTYVIVVILFFYTILFYPPELGVERLYDGKTKENFPELTDGSHPDLRDGKYILSFMSYSCPHCRTAAGNLSAMYAKDKNLPLIFIFSEKSKENTEGRESFFSELSYKDIPVMYMNHEDYIFLADRAVPSIYLITDMVINKKVDNYKSLTLQELQEWYRD